MKNILQQYQNLGWHLTSIDGYNLNGQAMYAAIWEQENSPDTRKITIAKSWVDFQQEWNENVASGTLQMFCLLNPQTNACKPNPKTTSSDFNR